MSELPQDTETSSVGVRGTACHFSGDTARGQLLTARKRGREFDKRRDRLQKKELFPGFLHIAGTMTHLSWLMFECAPKQELYQCTCEGLTHFYYIPVVLLTFALQSLHWLAEVKICHFDLPCLAKKKLYCKTFTPWPSLPSIKPRYI